VWRQQILVGSNFIIISTKLVKVMFWFCLFVCLFVFVCQQDYCKSNQPISLKLDVMIEPTNGKTRVTFGGDPISDMDSGSLFHFPHHFRPGHLGDFIGTSHIVTGRLSRNSTKWVTSTRDWKWIRYILAAIRRIPGSASIRTSGCESRIIFGRGTEKPKFKGSSILVYTISLSVWVQSSYY